MGERNVFGHDKHPNAAVGALSKSQPPCTYFKLERQLFFQFLLAVLLAEPWLVYVRVAEMC